MNITPVIPDGYYGPVKRLTCRICKHLFYLTKADYDRLATVHYCHECSLILREELERNQLGSSSMLPTETPPLASLQVKQVSNHFEPAYVSRRPFLPVPQLRSIDRDKMTVTQLLEEAKMLDKTWRYKEALTSYEQALLRDAGCLAAFYGKGEMLSQLNRPREALVVYDEILRLDPNSAKAWGEKGLMLLSLRRYTEAQAAFEQALQLDPSESGAHSGIHFLSSHIFRNPGVEEHADTVGKQTAAKETLAKPCQSAQDYYEAGNALITLKRDSEAFDAFARSTELDPFNLDVYERVSTLHFVRHNYEKSLATYDQALQIFIACAKLHEKRAEALVRLKRHQEALDACNRAIELDDTSASAYSQKGEILHWKLMFISERGRYADGLATCEACIAQNPHLAQAYEWRGHMLHYADRDEEALASYEEAHRLDPGDEGILLSKVGIFVQTKRFDEALEICEQAIRLVPTNPRAYEEKGNILSRLKRYEDALTAYRKAGQLDPQNPSAYQKAGDLLCELERFAEAVKAYDHVIRLRPDSDGAYRSKARALEKLKHYDQALATCNKGLQHNPENRSLLSTRADVLKQLLRYEEANADYDRIERIDPRSLYVLSSILGKVDLKQVAAAKARLEAAGNELSDEVIQAEIHLMYEEKRAAELKASLRASPLFGPLCLLMHEQKEWSGTPKQFKELICSRFPEEFSTWYRAPYKYVDELKKIAPELRVEGIAVGVPPETPLVTLTRTVMEEQLDRSEGATPGTRK